MLVTSDCHHLEEIAPYLPYEWAEVLVAGVGLYGPRWPSATSASGFLRESARATSVEKALTIGGYTIAGEKRTRNVKASSLEKVVSGAEQKGRSVSAVLLTGVEPRLGAASSGGTSLFVGGEVDASGAGKGPFRGSFAYPEDSASRRLGETILRLAATMLGAGYGFYFVRDDALLPRGYALGWIGGLAAVRIERRQELDELARWGELMRGEYWNMAHPPLRDVYEVNLLSERHLEHKVGARSLLEWIQDDAERGSVVGIEGIDGCRFIWSLSTDQIVRVRPELMLARLLFSRHERLYRKMTPRRAG